MVSNRDEAKQFLQAKKSEYPDARHHCWAYLIGNPLSASNAAMNDDGEPSGTAGKPILNVIQHKHIGDVMVVVTRYFGGVKLGAGGLTRAYSSATEMVLSELSLKEQVAITTAFLACEFSQEQAIRHWAKQHDAALEVLQYSHQVEIKLSLPISEKIPLEQFCLTNKIKKIEDENTRLS